MSNLDLAVGVELGMQLLELAFVLPDAAEGAACPHKAQCVAFGFGEVPVDVGGGMEAVGQRIKQQRRRDADIVTLSESEHWDAHVHIGVLYGIIREAEFLGAEHQGYGLANWYNPITIYAIGVEK